MAKSTAKKKVPQRPPGAEKTPFVRRRSTKWLGAALAVSLVMMIAGTYYLTRGAKEVSVDQALADFRSEQASKPANIEEQGAAVDRDESGASTAPPAPGKPGETIVVANPNVEGPAFPPGDPGVYVYKTEGYEETDALAGSRHDYPEETTITIRRGGCGWTSRWQPLDERWEESELCEKLAGTQMKRYTMYHEFFQRGSREEYQCDGYVQKPDSKPGDSWTMTCKSANGTAKSVTTAVGYEDVTVGGQKIKSIHIRYDITASGANKGKLIQDRWLSLDPRRLVKMTQTADLEVTTPFGPAGYKESYQIDLKSLDPRT